MRAALKTWAGVTCAPPPFLLVPLLSPLPFVNTPSHPLPPPPPGPHPFFLCETNHNTTVQIEYDKRVEKAEVLRRAEPRWKFSARYAPPSLVSAGEARGILGLGKKAMFANKFLQVGLRDGRTGCGTGGVGVGCGTGDVGVVGGVRAGLADAWGATGNDVRAWAMGCLQACMQQLSAPGWRARVPRGNAQGCCAGRV